jgi:hypothetical protein
MQRISSVALEEPGGIGARRASSAVAYALRLKEGVGRDEARERGGTMRRTILIAASLLLALPAAADPILTVTPSTIALSPTQTVLTFDVDPSDTPLAGLLFNLSSLASGLEIVSIASAEPGVILTSGPVLSGGDYQASFSAFFFPDRIASFTVGTVTVEGFTPGTPLVLTGEWTDSLFNTIPIPPTNVALVAAPEPASAALFAIGLAGLAVVGRRSRRRARSAAA